MKLDEHLVLEFTVRFELSTPKGGFSWAWQAPTGSSDSLNIIFLIPPSSSLARLVARSGIFVKLDEHLVLEFIVRFQLLAPMGGFSWALQASIGSLESLNVNFFEPTI